MIFHESAVRGAWIIDLEPIEDERGFFARAFNPEDFAARGLNDRLLHCSVAFNRARGTVRGMHCQAPPHAEAKLVRCSAGAIHDVAVDLRPDSPTFRRWVAVELSAENRRMLYIPEGVAHGYQTLADGSEVFYQISARYHPEAARGVRWNDPAFGIAWPLPVGAINARDRAYPDFSP